MAALKPIAGHLGAEPVRPQNYALIEFAQRAPSDEQSSGDEAGSMEPVR